MARACERKAGVLVFLTLAVSYIYFFQGGGWNQNSRLDLTRALASGQGLAIDRFRRNTGDWAYFAGHYYTNKSPALSLLSLPPFLAAQRLSERRGWAGSDFALPLSAYAANAIVNGLASALLGLLVFQALGALSLGSPATCAWLALAFGLGTLAFPYATAYYAHQPAAATSFAAFSLIATARQENRGRRALLAGAALGMAIALELSTAATAAILAAVFFARPQRRGLGLCLFAGAAPILAALGVYNHICFGSFLSGGYGHSNPAVMVTENGRLLGAPRLERVAALLFSPHRGVLFSSPMLALAPFGLRGLFRRERKVALVCALVPAAFLLLFSSFHGWEGGWGPGPRYLVPCLPFLFIPAAAAARRMPRVFAALAAVSVALMLAITAVAVEVPAGSADPLGDFIFPWLLRGKVSVNPQGLDDYLPPLEYLRLGSADNWNSFNLGEFLFPHSLASLLPLLALWSLAGALLERLGRAELSRNR